MRTPRAWIVLGSLLAVGCGGGGSPPARVAIVPEPAGANCPAGGSAVRVGVDSNQNGGLDESEVTGTTYVCNGAPYSVPLPAVDTDGVWKSPVVRVVDMAA
jgi:hypothetical protein